MTCNRRVFTAVKGRAHTGASDVAVGRAARLDLPKSVTPARIAENGAIFDFALDADTMRTLDGLDVGFRASWDPTDVP